MKAVATVMIKDMQPLSFLNDRLYSTVEMLDKHYSPVLFLFEFLIWHSPEFYFTSLFPLATTRQWNDKTGPASRAHSFSVSISYTV